MDKKNLAHNVFFTLKDTSETVVKTLIEDCYTYLKDLPGIIYFSAGSLVPELNSNTNVTDYNVGLHIIFADKSYHDQYEVAEKHKIFIKRNSANWAKIRVFDTYVK